MASACPICSKPLSDGPSVVYKGEQLIHASCWIEEPEKPAKPGRTATPPPDKAPPQSSAAQLASDLRVLGPMVGCPQCTQHEGKALEPAVEITRWTDTGTQTLYRCPRCGWEEIEPRQPLQPAKRPEPPAEQDRNLAS
jgi:hypothetical protein